MILCDSTQWGLHNEGMVGLLLWMLAERVRRSFQNSHFRSSRSWPVMATRQYHTIQQSVACTLLLYSFLFFGFLFVEMDRANHQQIRTSGQTSISMHVLLSPAINSDITHDVSFSNMYSGIMHARIRMSCFLVIVEQAGLNAQKTEIFSNFGFHSTGMQIAGPLSVPLYLASAATYCPILS